MAFKSITSLRAVAGSLKPALILLDACAPSYEVLADQDRRVIAEGSAIDPLILMTRRKWGFEVAVSGFRPRRRLKASRSA
jgi:hypothetical protein